MLHHSQAINYRQDIDGLRAIAVMSVLIFHAFPTWMPGGFIGVDIFFVISGYLITSILYQSVKKKTFCLSEFYARRIIRIFPALLVVLVAVLLLGGFSMMASEYKELARYVLAGTLFFSNLLSWRDAGYFDVNAEEKPLLHLWSLGVEEQFYLIWPITFLLIRNRSDLYLKVVWIFAFLSFLVNIISVQTDAVAAFYSPFSRFFELMAGALVFFSRQIHEKQIKGESEASLRRLVLNQNLMSILGALFILTGLLMIDSSKQFPGVWVLLPIIGTMLLIQAGPSAWLNSYILSLRPLVWVGLISYPLYLWHQPVLSFSKVIIGGTPSREVRLLCVIFAVGLAWATFRFVEMPIRRRIFFQTFKKLKLTAFGLIIAMFVVSLTAGLIIWRKGFPERFPNLVSMDQAVIEEIDKRKHDPVFMPCDKSLPISTLCLFSKIPESGKLLLIGDSHGSALASGLSLALQEDRPSISVVVQSLGGCSPLRGVESRNQAGMSRNCRDEFEAVYKWAMADKSVQTVILVSRWAERVGAAVGFGAVDGNQTTGRYSYLENAKEVVNNSDVFVRALRHTLLSLQSSGKKVVFVHQVPEFGFYPPFCGSRPFDLSTWKDGKDRCTIDMGLVESRQNEYRMLFDSVKNDFPDLQILDPVPVFCNQSICSLRQGSKYFYRDDDHLNLEGSYLFSKKILAIVH